MRASAASDVRHREASGVKRGGAKSLRRIGAGESRREGRAGASGRERTRILAKPRAYSLAKSRRPRAREQGARTKFDATRPGRAPRQARAVLTAGGPDASVAR